ncbi:hypothetical protein XELAEV_18032390mg [Xenopus laevis]|uniref:Uncharacterized protein n=1 Tax=Xenopus laevis TaxID=8355 RepID=A0A974HGK2_XENLA|nr:hypothetical protein XELAEV_18032390mg [Xenopus laevis]
MPSLLIWYMYLPLSASKPYYLQWFQTLTINLYKYLHRYKHHCLTLCSGAFLQSPFTNCPHHFSSPPGTCLAPLYSLVLNIISSTHPAFCFLLPFIDLGLSS